MQNVMLIDAKKQFFYIWFFQFLIMNFYITQRWGRFYDRILSLKVSFCLRASKCSNSFLDFLQLCCFEMIISGKLGQTYTVLINVQFITFFTRLDKHFIFYIARSAFFIICMLRYAYCFACLEKHLIWNSGITFA